MKTDTYGEKEGEGGDRERMAEIRFCVSPFAVNCSEQVKDSYES